MQIDPIYYVLLAALAIAALAVLVARHLYRKNRELNRRLGYRAKAWPAPAPRKTPEQEQDERLAEQLEAVMRQTVKFSASRVMGRGEFELFRAALTVTRQPLPPAFYVFPQVALGQIPTQTPPIAPSTANGPTS